MKNFFKGLFTGILMTIIGFFIYDSVRGKEKPKIKIVKETKTEFKYIRQPIDCDEFKICYESQLDIIGGIEEGNIFHVTAFDFCKKAQKDFQLEAVGLEDRYRKTIAIRYGLLYVNKEIYNLYGLSFSYRWRFLSLGLTGDMNLNKKIIGINGQLGYSF